MVDHWDENHHATDDDDAEPHTEDANAARRERTVNAVLQRIATAPARPGIRMIQPALSAWVDIEAWRVPALAAAALVMMVSGAVIAKSDQQPSAETPGAMSGRLPAPLARYLATGEVTPMEWLNTFGGRP